VAAGAQLKADATVEGDGGTVVVWADGATRYEGSLSARGGALGGNGGRAEVSGKQYLDFRGTADLRANAGQRGSLLLDPLNIIVGANDNFDGSGYGSIIDLSNQTIYPSVTSYVSHLTIESLLATADVTLAATNDITLQNSISTVGSSTTTTTLKLDAGHDIVLDSNSLGFAMSLGSYSNALNINLIAGNSIRTVGYGASIYSQGGRIDLKAGAGGINGVISGVNLLNLYSNGTAKVGGNVQINSDGIVAINTIFAAGYGGAETGSRGYNGGVVNVDAVGAITIDTINAKGRDADSLSQTSLSGGSGGSVSVVGGAGTDVTTIDVGGGSGVSGGSNGSGGDIAFTLNAGDIVYGSTVVGASSVTLKALTGSITQTNAINVASLSTTSATGTTLTNSSNAISSFSATNTGSGAVSLTNVGALSIGSITNSNGSISIDNTGDLSTVGAVTAGGAGTVSLIAHSPITIGAGGVSAGGNVTLTATTASAASNITLNGSIQSTGGGVTMSAYNSLTQNSYVYGARGVTASTTTGAITFGPNGYSGGSPLSYADVNGAVRAPLFPGSSLASIASLGGSVADFLDQFLAALDEQATFSDDPFDPRNRDQDALVVEGQICTP
jgi:hypothetical protein